MWDFLLAALLAQAGSSLPPSGSAEARADLERRRALSRDSSDPFDQEVPDASDAGLRADLALESPAQGGMEGLSLRANVGVRWLSGHTSVRENEVQGTRLEFHRDLGLTYASGFELAFMADQPSWQFTMEVEYLIGFGSQSVEETFFYNGHTFVGPSRVRDHLQMLTVRPQFAIKALTFPEERAWVGPVIGLEYPYYLLSVKSQSQPNSLEDWTHFLPYPVLGAAGRIALGDGLTGELRVTAGYVPNLPVPYVEGGRLYVSARPTVFVEAPLGWRVSRSLELSAIFSFQYWSGVDHSGEDGNILTFSAAGVLVGLAYHW